MKFPTDDVTLGLLSIALRPRNDSDRSSLFDFLELMGEMHFDFISDNDIPTRWSVHDVIESLIEEITTLRTELKRYA